MTNDDFNDMLSSDCQKCDAERVRKLVERTGNWTDGLVTFMMVCSVCGNKRCPKATDHDNECSGSNAPGQEGSSYR